MQLLKLDAKIQLLLYTDLSKNHTVLHLGACHRERQAQAWRSTDGFRFLVHHLKKRSHLFSELVSIPKIHSELQTLHHLPVIRNHLPLLADLFKDIHKCWRHCSEAPLSGTFLDTGLLRAIRWAAPHGLGGHSSSCGGPKHTGYPAGLFFFCYKFKNAVRCGLILATWCS